MESCQISVHENRILHFKSCSGFRIITSLANFSFHGSNKYKRNYASVRMADSCLPRERLGSKTCRREEEKADMVNWGSAFRVYVQLLYNDKVNLLT
jgi:hypothetical protein